MIQQDVSVMKIARTSVSNRRYSVRKRFVHSRLILLRQLGILIASKLLDTISDILVYLPFSLRVHSFLFAFLPQKISVPRPVVFHLQLRRKGYILLVNLSQGLTMKRTALHNEIADILL
jgi:hypothetical protein